MPDLSPEQRAQWEQSLRALLREMWADQEGHLLYWRGWFEAERIRRGYHLTLNEWLPTPDAESECPPAE